MAGIRIPVQPRMKFSFPANLPSGASAVIPLQLHIDARACVSGVLEVILYTKSITGTGATAVVAVVNDALTSDGRSVDPQGQLVSSVPIAAGSLANTSSPMLYSAVFAAPIASRLSVLLTLGAGSAAASGDVELEAWITMRDA